MLGCGQASLVPRRPASHATQASALLPLPEMRTTSWSVVTTAPFTNDQPSPPNSPKLVDRHKSRLRRLCRGGPLVFAIYQVTNFEVTPNPAHPDDPDKATKAPVLLGRLKGLFNAGRPHLCWCGGPACHAHSAHDPLQHERTVADYCGRVVVYGRGRRRDLRCRLHEKARLRPPNRPRRRMTPTRARFQARPTGNPGAHETLGFTSTF